MTYTKDDQPAFRVHQPHRVNSSRSAITRSGVIIPVCLIRLMSPMISSGWSQFITGWWLIWIWSHNHFLGIFRILGYPLTIMRTAYRKQFYPKPMVPTESSDGVPFASLDSGESVTRHLADIGPWRVPKILAPFRGLYLPNAWSQTLPTNKSLGFPSIPLVWGKTVSCRLCAW